MSTEPLPFHNFLRGKTRSLSEMVFEWRDAETTITSAQTASGARLERLDSLRISHVQEGERNKEKKTRESWSETSADCRRLKMPPSRLQTQWRFLKLHFSAPFCISGFFYSWTTNMADCIPTSSFVKSAMTNRAAGKFYVIFTVSFILFFCRHLMVRLWI